MHTDEFMLRLADGAARVEAMLEALLAERALAGEIARPEKLVAAMRYAALGGGKRMRPFLLIESARMFGVEGVGPVRAGAALELLHCYSLAHDDLPAMDDDDMRRGRPSLHRAFGEATAILAGDALLTLAFDVAADPATDTDGAVRAELVSLLARAAGVGGMAGGQMLDLAAEITPPDEAGIRRLQAMKTGALIRFACEAGAVLGRAVEADRARLRDFGAAIGAAFQLADDLLDATGDAAAMGKGAAKDAAACKATLVALYGTEQARAMLDAAIVELVAMLKPFGERGDILAAAARFIASRET